MFLSSFSCSLSRICLLPELVVRNRINFGVSAFFFALISSPASRVSTKMESTTDSRREEKGEEPKPETDAEYPGNAQRAAIMTAMYLTLFLVNLVRLRFIPPNLHEHALTKNVGHQHHLDSHSSHHR
jgi:hypothetical protein